MNVIRSTVSTLRDRLAPLSHTSTFRSTGQITPEEFLLAGDYLVYKFPTWSWSGASPSSRSVTYLPPDKQFLITRGVPCHRRLDENFAGDAGVADAMVRDGFEYSEEERGKHQGREAGGDDDGWLRTGGMAESQEARVRDVRTVDEAGNMGERMEEEDDDEEAGIPDMEDEEDDEEAIIRDPKSRGTNAPPRTYTLHITYTPYYRTPRLYLSGYLSPSEPLPPTAMMEDIVGDYADKTVTLEDFPFYSAGLKMASVHPCKHASVMKTLLDRADAALKLRLQKAKRGQVRELEGGGLEGLVDGVQKVRIEEGMMRGLQSQQGQGGNGSGVAGGPGVVSGAKEGDEWEVLQSSPPGGGTSPDEEEVAIRVDQYLVVFLKFMASVTPGIEHDFTMGV